MVYADEVEANLAEISTYIAQDSPATARRFIQELKRACASLETLPERGAFYGANHRCIIVGGYRIAYHIETRSDVKIVTVVAIDHTARDLTPPAADAA